MSFVPEPVIATASQRTFTLTELLTLPRYTIEEYISWGVYLDILKRILDDIIAGKHVGSATRLQRGHHDGGLLARLRDYDRWDKHCPNLDDHHDNGRHKRAAVTTGDDAVEMNIRLLMMGFGLDALRFWPLVGEGLCAIFFKNIDLSGYHDGSTYCRTWIADFIVELWSGLTELQEYKGTPLNAALPWA